MSLVFLMFAFLATGADGEICNVKRAGARAADANVHHQRSFFSPPLAPQDFIFNSDVHDDDDDHNDENVTDVKTRKTRCVQV